MFPSQLTATQDASEDVRKNVNSYLDGVTGNKSVDNDIHPDAKRAGDELSKAATEAGQKISNATDSTKKTT